MMRKLSNTSNGDTYETDRIKFEQVLKEAETRWREWDSVVEAILGNNANYALKTLTVDESHPCHNEINAQNIPVIGDNKQLFFVLHGLPERGHNGFVSREKLEQLAEKTDKDEWMILLGTSGAGKTRSVFEMLCGRFGVYITMVPGQQHVTNLGSRDLFEAIDEVKKLKKRNRPTWNSDMALTMTRAVLVGRLFVLHKLLELRNDNFTPKTWLLMQNIPKYSLNGREDLWLTMSKVFQSARNSDLASYIGKLVSDILKITDTHTQKQKRLPIVIDEIQEAVDMLKDTFSAKTSEYRRSLVAILLRMACGMEVDRSNLSTVLCGTGLRYSDLINELGSASYEKNIPVTTRDIVCIDEGFDTIERMKSFIERFVGVNTFSDHQMRRIFGYLQGRFRFTVKFLESFVNISTENNSTVDYLIGRALDTTVNHLVEQLKINIDRLQQASDDIWLKVENAIIEYHIFSSPVILKKYDTAFAVEVGLGQLKYTEDSPIGIMVVSGFSEPLAIIAYFQKFKSVTTIGIGEKIIDKMTENTENESHHGKLFERYLIDPLFKMFNKDNTRRLGKHKLLSSVVKEHATLQQLLSYKIQIHGTDLTVFCERPTEDSTLFESTPPNHCGRGDLNSYLRDPKEMFFFPEKTARPDIVFIIKLYRREHKEYVLIPVFVQAKLAKNVTMKDALATTRPEHFYKDKRAIEFYEEKYRLVQECMESQYAKAKEIELAYVSILIAYPYKVNRKKFDTTYKNGVLTIIIDESNIGQFITREEDIITLDLLKSIPEDGIPKPTPEEVQVKAKPQQKQTKLPETWIMPKSS